ncbi:MAG: hypothetical protein HYX35_04830 [Proteobacteria bacterium]|nr:hypothetical protein [Pseudomonadota bacterium]
MRQETQRLKNFLEKDPLLLKQLWDEDMVVNPFLKCTLQTSLLSALSYPLFEMSDAAGFKMKLGGLSLAGLTQPGDAVTVIGLGGYLHSALKNPDVRRVFLADLYLERPHAIQEIEQLRKRHPDKELLVSDGSENESILRQSQIACITASSLSNGTLPSFLASTRNCRATILQGKSGNVFPTALFRAGITHVTTYMIRPESWHLIQKQCLDHPDGDFSTFVDAHFHDSVSYAAK